VVRATWVVQEGELCLKCQCHEISFASFRRLYEYIKINKITCLYRVCGKYF